MVFEGAVVGDQELEIQVRLPLEARKQVLQGIFLIIARRDDRKKRHQRIRLSLDLCRSTRIPAPEAAWD